MNPEQLQGQPAVPKQIFEEFLKRLANTETPVEVVEGLREVLLGTDSITESAVRAAIFPADEET